MTGEPNDRQLNVIKNTEGIYLVDAGPGTGKTFTLTRRYVELIENNPDIEPDDVLFVTFTRNGARQMKERIVDLSDSYPASVLREAPIRTFHSHASRILSDSGFTAPNLLGIDDYISTSTEVIERSVNERERFLRYYDWFVSTNDEFRAFYPAVRRPEDLLRLIKKLAVKGIAPGRDGWVGDVEKLDGDEDQFMDELRDYNRPGEGKRGPTNSELRKKLTGFYDENLFKNPPTKEELGITRDNKKISETLVRQAFTEKRPELKKFIHDLYYGYLKYALAKNYLNYNFLLLFSFLLLREDSKVREDQQFDYLMIDEFQDTNELQLKLSLLLSRTGNMCAVGDWKQSIFKFRFADVDNILEFEDRLKKYRDDLNREERIVDFSVTDVATEKLTKNYRSVDDVIRFSEHSLYLRGSKQDEVDRDEVMDKVVRLQEVDSHPGGIELFTSPDETLGVLSRIQEVVENQELQISCEDEDSGDIRYRPVEYGDIAVLTRTNDFALNLQKAADHYCIPVVFEGGIALFQTREAVLLLAWLRVLEDKSSSKGWAVILEEAGYLLDEVENIIREHDYPDGMINFRSELSGYSEVSATARAIFNRYHIASVYADEIIKIIAEIDSNLYTDLSDVIKFIESQNESREKYEVESGSTAGDPGNQVTIRTIHRSKGLEFPVVFLVDVNKGRFPRGDNNSGCIFYDETLGLRATKFMDADENYLFDDWKSKLLKKCLPPDYAEERRLSYVAMTRAKQYLFVSARDNGESRFFKDLLRHAEDQVTINKVVSEPKRLARSTRAPEKFYPQPVEDSRRYTVNASALSDEKRAQGGGIGREKGNLVHKFAQAYASGRDYNKIETGADNELEKHLNHVQSFLDDIRGDRQVELPCYLPLVDNLTGFRFIVRGKIDLLVRSGEGVRIIDYKTTPYGEEIEQEHRKQLSTYFHAVKNAYGDEKFNYSLEILYTGDGLTREIDPYPAGVLSGFCRELLMNEGG